MRLKALLNIIAMILSFTGGKIMRFWTPGDPPVIREALWIAIL
jgi:hypothetical protein